MVKLDKDTLTALTGLLNSRAGVTAISMWLLYMLLTPVVNDIPRKMDTLITEVRAMKVEFLACKQKGSF